MGYQSSYTQWLTSDEVSAEDKARLASLSEEEKKRHFIVRSNSARQV